MSTITGGSTNTSRFYYTNASDPMVWLDEAAEIKEDYKMDKFVSDNFKNTDDALLVQKWLAKDLPCDSVKLNQLLLGDNLPALLEEAKRLEEESK